MVLLRQKGFLPLQRQSSPLLPLPRKGKPIQQGQVASEMWQETEKKPDIVAQSLLGLSHWVLLIDKALQRLHFISLKTSWLEPVLWIHGGKLFPKAKIACLDDPIIPPRSNISFGLPSRSDLARIYSWHELQRNYEEKVLNAFKGEQKGFLFLALYLVIKRQQTARISYNHVC